MKKVLILNKNQKNLELMSQFFHQHGITSCLAANYKDLESFLQDEDLGVALLDISGFDNNIWSYCQELRSRDIPFVLISATRTDKLDATSIKEGARGVLIKPLSPKQLLTLVQTILGQ